MLLLAKKPSTQVCVPPCLFLQVYQNATAMLVGLLSRLPYSSRVLGGFGGLLQLFVHISSPNLDTLRCVSLPSLLDTLCGAPWHHGDLICDQSALNSY